MTTAHRRAGIMATGWPHDVENLPRRAGRVIDICIAAALLVFLLPLMISIAILIKIDSPGTVLFKQQRLGRNNHLFDLYKFRSMRCAVCGIPVMPPAWRHDPRVSRVGRFLRYTGLDELPQLINVLKGEASLVGPRPPGA